MLFVINYFLDVDEEYFCNFFKVYGEIYSIWFFSFKENVKWWFCYFIFWEWVLVEVVFKLDGKVLGGRCRFVVKIFDLVYK